MRLLEVPHRQRTAFAQRANLGNLQGEEADLGGVSVQLFHGATYQPVLPGAGQTVLVQLNSTLSFQLAEIIHKTISMIENRNAFRKINEFAQHLK